MTDTVSDSTGVVDRDMGGCPVAHVEVFAPAEAGSYWRTADELRQAGDRFYNTLAQGFWMFTRYEQVREIYNNPETFSSESFTPGSPIRSIGSSRLRSTHRSTRSTARSSPAGSRQAR